ncbi:MAG: type transport system permease protein, partial [Thermotoga sp.]|nr:type transport system permease protein [Thermotoga sp.]
QLVAIGVVGVLGYALSTGSHLMFFSILLATVVGSVFGFIWAFKRIVFRAERLEE